MAGLKEKLYKKSPNIIQNGLVSIFNIIAYNTRYSNDYKKLLKEYNAAKNLSKDELIALQEEKYKDFIGYAYKHSAFFKDAFKAIKNPDNISNISKLPIINKEILRKNLQSIYTIPMHMGSVSKTGGTTGKSLEVIYTKKDIQERFAILDSFRHNFGYKLGKKTAWFSGKDLLTNKDLRKNRFWKTDYYYKVRYYSTFHIHSKYMRYYIENLIKFKPEYLVGFPSTMYEIAKYGIQYNIDFPKGVVKAIFPTAETITDEIRQMLEGYFKTDLYNQYASSEGAPFIIECINHKLHIELQSGVFEVLDSKNKPAKKGRLVVTSFNTHGTPLIRYDIGDEIELSDEVCNCGNNNPLAKSVLGRISDYIYSEETGKINLGNISNCLKGVKGIIKFQIQQDEINKLKILIEKDDDIYNAKYENIFLENLKDRVGKNMQLDLSFVDKIPVEKSGKYRLIKNNVIV